MQKWMQHWALVVLIGGSVCGWISSANADEVPAATELSLAEGKIQFKAPGNWTKKKPANNIIEAEFSIAPAEGDEIPGRLTAMGAGGEIEANIERWKGQFTAAPGGDVLAKKETLQIADQKVHWVDLSGTYKDSPGGPFAGGKTIMREKYRMLGVIIETKKAGNYFLKFYGPQATVTANEKAFRSMVESLSVK